MKSRRRGGGLTRLFNPSKYKKQASALLKLIDDKNLTDKIRPHDLDKLREIKFKDSLPKGAGAALDEIKAEVDRLQKRKEYDERYAHVDDEDMHQFIFNPNTKPTGGTRRRNRRSRRRY